MRTRVLSWLTLVALTTVAALAGGCRSPEGETVSDKRASVLEMREATLARLYSEKPEAKEKIAGAAGYGVFSSLGMKFLIASGNGYGVVRNNSTGDDTYMQMRELGLGIGLGVKDTRIVIVFHSADSMTQLTESGWEWGGDAEASAKSGESGADAGLGVDSKQGTEAYVMTEAGIALQATVTGTKYWKSEELNAK